MALSVAARLRLRCRLSHGLRWALASGTLAAVATVSYPPLRVTVPLVLAMVGAILLATVERRRVRRLHLWYLLLAASVLVLLTSPTLIELLRHRINERMEGVAILGSEWLDQHRGTVGRIPFVLITLLDNLLLHLRPSYLFFTGDPNGRHSPQIVGQLSFLDSFAVVVAAVATVRLILRSLRQVIGRPTEPIRSIAYGPRVMLVVAGASILGGAFGALPASLTHDSLPHSLRSSGAWPWVSLFTGAVLAMAWAYRSWAIPATTVVALSFTAYYFPMYHHAYQELDGGLFQREMTDDLAKDDDGDNKLPVRDTASRHIGLGDEVLRYYLITLGHADCDRSSEVMKEIREKAAKH
jgi:hypothetical protein